MSDIPPFSFLEVMEVRKRIHLNKRYSLPDDIKVVHHNEVILVIAPSCANYIILHNQKQVEFFLLLYEFSLKEAIVQKEELGLSEDDISNVITQIEAKHFYNLHAYEVRGLFQMHLYLTNACNLKCPHCYMFSGKPYDDELSFNEICKLLESFKNHGGVFLILSGGEVTVRQDFPAIVKFGHKIGLSINVMTNGTLWSKEMVEDLAPYISSVQISIDGYNEETNSRVRGIGSFQKSLETIDMFLRLGISTTVAITPWLDENLKGQIDRYIQFRKDLEYKYRGKRINIKFSGDLMSGRSINVDQATHANYATIMKRIMYAEQYDTMERDSFVYNQKQKTIKRNWCTYGHLTVTATGDLYFCGKISECKPFGNLRKMPLEQIMELCTKVREISEVDNLIPCKDCELRYICGGDCRIKYFSFLYDRGNMIKSDLSNKSLQINRVCTRFQKSYWYDLMIEANEYLYT